MKGRPDVRLVVGSGVESPTGKVLVQVICRSAHSTIATVRTDPTAGPTLWYRVPLSPRARLPRPDDPLVEIIRDGLPESDEIEVGLQMVVHRVEDCGGVRTVYLAVVPPGSKRQLGRLKGLSDDWYTLALGSRDELARVTIGCERCAEHALDLAELGAVVVEATTGSGAARFLVG